MKRAGHVRLVAVAAVAVIAYGCATTAPPPKATPETMTGAASWYGEEFAGRTTANGEIFDPALLTAAHRTLPFGTILDVTNQKNGRSVKVRVNDRGPYIASRVIDLSYAAAARIGLIEPGVGDVNIRVVKMGSGEREPPAPFDVTIAEAPKSIPVRPTPASTTPLPPASNDVPSLDIPPPPTSAPTTPEPVVVDRVEVEVEHGDVVTRKQVAANGTTIEEVPLAPSVPPPPPRIETRRPPPARPGTKRYIVQVGAFAVEANATALQSQLAAIGQQSWIESSDLFRVRIGPFATRDEAARARAKLEANGLSAMIVSGD